MVVNMALAAQFSLREGLLVGSPVCPIIQNDFESLKKYVEEISE